MQSMNVIGQRAAVGTTMAPMTGYPRGQETRRAVLTELLAREPLSIRALATAAGIVYSHAYQVVRLLERDGLVSVSRRMGPHGSEVRLTPAGREAARLAQH